MDLDDVLQRRKSARSFTNWAPPEGDIRKVLDAANLAPSAGDLKARSIIVVKGESKRKALAKAAHDQNFLAEAPYVLVFCADLKKIEDYGERGKNLYAVQDASAAAENALLKITDLGLGGCWVGAFDEDGVREACGLPDNLRPVALVPVGYER